MKTWKHWTKEEDNIVRNNSIKDAKSLLNRSESAIISRKYVTLSNKSPKRVYNNILTKVDDSNVTININGNRITSDLNTIKKLINM